MFILFEGSLRRRFDYMWSFSTAGTREVDRKHSADQHYFPSLPASALFKPLKRCTVLNYKRTE